MTNRWPISNTSVRAGNNNFPYRFTDLVTTVYKLFEIKNDFPAPNVTELTHMFVP